MQMHWFTSVLLATVGISPVLLLTGVAQRNFSIQSDVTAAIWMAGVTLGLFAWIIGNGRGGELVMVTGMRTTLFLFSLTIGAAANVLLFHAFATAPNPGLAAGVFNSNALVAFLLAPILAYFAPTFFPNWEFSWHHGIGIAMVIGGIGLIAK